MLQRVRALEEAGGITKYVTSLDIDRLCENVKIFASITLKSQRPRDLAAFESAVQRTPEFVDCLRVAGRVDYIALVVCATMKNFRLLCEELLERDLGVVRIDSYSLLKGTKGFSGYALGQLESK